MTVRELREKYLQFFESKGHQRFPSGSLVPIDVTGRLDESLLFNGAGMIQFKPYFRGTAKPAHPRLATVQKCVRTNDIDEVGDATHLSFFEMLGNFSFGDYFKSEAIAYSWEFLTSPEWLALDPAKLSFTVFEADDEAFSEWSKWIAPTGIDPATRVFRLGEETNYWPAGAFSKGPPGPCGPNSEMFYWVAKDRPAPTGAYTREDWIADDAAGNWVEIWNDVFIQYEWQGHENPTAKGWVKDGMPDLPFRSIDTGMGLDRTAFVLAGKSSVYENGSFDAIFSILNELTGDGLDYATEAGPKGQAARVVGDHIRNTSFCIADGILPSNNGRGYVVRRLIRRAVLKGQRALGIADAFLHKVFEGVVEAMVDAYPELEERRPVILETLRNEEALFRRTLKSGSDLLATELETTVGQLPGAVAFNLYDTFGFPLEITQELCAEAGISVDLEGYQDSLKEAQDRSRGAQGETSAYGGLSVLAEEATPDAPAETTFLGYSQGSSEAKVVRVRTKDGKAFVSLDQTPFYAESGGQSGDTGTLRGEDQTWSVVGTTKTSGVWWHELAEAEPPALGTIVTAEIDQERRARIQRHHTATHLLHAALRQTLGTHISQAGSFVGPDYLRFDFTHGAPMTLEQRQTVEQLMNAAALQNADVVTHVDLPIGEAKARGAMALFGEKYGDFVRMVEIGEFSRELCGGTHVRTAAEVGLVRIVSENSAASGIRRIEAVAGEAAYGAIRAESDLLRDLAARLKAPVPLVADALERSLEQLKEERKKREKAEMAALTGGGSAEVAVVDVNGVSLWRRNFGETDPKVANQAVESAHQPNQVTLAALTQDGKVTFICKVGPEAMAKGAHAGNLLREVAKITGGGGGGRPEFGTAGGKEPAKIEDALSAAEAILAGMITG